MKIEIITFQFSFPKNKPAYIFYKIYKVFELKCICFFYRQLAKSVITSSLKLFSKAIPAKVKAVSLKVLLSI